jgi:hypothetical protein
VAAVAAASAAVAAAADNPTTNPLIPNNQISRFRNKQKKPARPVTIT